MKIVKELEYNDDGTQATVRFEDGTTETRATTNLSDLRFVNAGTGKVVRWGKDGLYKTTEGWARL